VGGLRVKSGCIFPIPPRRQSRSDRLCLRQPDDYVHGSVEADGGRQLGMRLLPLAYLGVESIKPQVAVRLEGAYAPFLNEG
jgi:hypothetical protein